MRVFDFNPGQRDPGPQRRKPPAPWPDFTFKRVGVPTPGQSGPRITVQVDRPRRRPRTQSGRQAAPSAELPRRGRDRLGMVLDHRVAPRPTRAGQPTWLEGDGGAGRPARGSRNRACNICRISPPSTGPRSWPPPIGTEVSAPRWWSPSSRSKAAGRVTAESGKGAQGLMQLIPDTAARFGVEDATDPAQNIKGGVEIPLLADRPLRPRRDPGACRLQRGRKRRGRPWRRAALCRNPRLRAQGAWPPGRWRAGLCQTRPELLASDGCVFAVREATNG